MPRLCKPVVVVHGASDAVVRPSIVEQHKALREFCATL
jgi:hypothetical protein